MRSPSRGRVLTTPLRPGASTGWDDFRDVTPDRALLYRTDEAFPVDYRLTVEAQDKTLKLVAPSAVLAHNEWFNSPALYDSLAAFVQPNTRAVEAVLRSAAQILLARTGSGSLQGYQDGPERAALIAGAVYEALRQLEITYQTLPASFENSGQKVRTTAAVLDGRLGNCVDLSVTYAACLEAAGLHPLIFISEGHAFGGFLLEEERLGSAAVTETNLLISMVDSGRAVPVELTRIGPGAQSATFTEAVRVGLGHFRGRVTACRASSTSTWLTVPGSGHCRRPTSWWRPHRSIPRRVPAPVRRRSTSHPVWPPRSCASSPTRATR